MRKDTACNSGATGHVIDTAFAIKASKGFGLHAEPDLTRPMGQFKLSHTDAAGGWCCQNA